MGRAAMPLAGEHLRSTGSWLGGGRLGRGGGSGLGGGAASGGAASRSGSAAGGCISSAYSAGGGRDGGGREAAAPCLHTYNCKHQELMASE